MNEPLMDRETVESMTAGDCGEPSYTTLAGYPICDRCGKSTRNKNALTCAPCRKGTRFILTPDDRQFLRAVGVR